MKITGSATGVVGQLLNTRNDGTFVFRVYGEIDPATGRKRSVDYELRIDDLKVEIVQPQACFAQDQDGTNCLLDFPPAARKGAPP